MKYFKVVYGYNQDEYISITSAELAKAIYTFMSATGRASFDGGAIRGQDIMRIVPDWHRAMGWNKTYKMTAEDHREIAPLESVYAKTYEKAKVIAEYAIKENKPDVLALPPQEVFEKISPKALIDKKKGV